MSTVTSPYLQGNFAPVTDEVTHLDLPVTGTLPAELAGRLLRIGPNPLTPPDPATYHWFVGDGMVHGLRLRDGRAAWYRNRWVRGDEVANTHVIGVGGRTFALVEAGNPPVELTDELETVGTCRFDDTLDGSFSAHTHEDPDTGLLHAVTYHWSWDHVRHVVVGPDAHVRREVQVPVPDGPSVHDCAITERFVVIFDLPVTFSMDAVSAGARFPYRWDPAHPPRVGLLPLDGAAEDVRWFDAPSCYVFHTLNAFDDVDAGGTEGHDRVVVDVVRHPKMFATVTNGPDEGDPVLERWTLDLASGGLTTDVLDDHPQEFPRIDERRTGRPHRYGYGATLAPGAHHGPALKHDLVAGTTTVHDYGTGRVTLEPVFVPRPDATAEDDGWVLSYVYDATTDRTDVVVLDARDFGGDPVATVHLPVRVPFGFHGSWVPDGG
ncbi:MAG TPA: carotenoid oxygenase family protein [Acidimicrobiales bacterium]|nr:carotenoid oxygenase family protein [Acidimicrobiales bacterium]